MSGCGKCDACKKNNKTQVEGEKLEVLGMAITRYVKRTVQDHDCEHECGERCKYMAALDGAERMLQERGPATDFEVVLTSMLRVMELNYADLAEKYTGLAVQSQFIKAMIRSGAKKRRNGDDGGDNGEKDEEKQ